jgi:hypothetical protein
MIGAFFVRKKVIEVLIALGDVQQTVVCTSQRKRYRVLYLAWKQKLCTGLFLRYTKYQRRANLLSCFLFSSFFKVIRSNLWGESCTRMVRYFSKIQGFLQAKAWAVVEPCIFCWISVSYRRTWFNSSRRILLVELALFTLTIKGIVIKSLSMSAVAPCFSAKMIVSLTLMYGFKRFRIYKDYHGGCIFFFHNREKIG